MTNTKEPKDPKRGSAIMADQTKDSTTTTTNTTTTTGTTTTRETTSGGKLTTGEDDTSESNDAPYQGKRSTGGYVPT